MSSSSSDTLFQLRQSAILLLTAMIWGATFVAQSLGMDSVGPFTFTTTRMLLGAFFLLPIVLLRRKRLAAEKPAEAARRSAPQYRRTLLMGGILCGLCLFGGESLQQFGFVHDTEVGKSGFITALYIVFVPIISLFLGRRAFGLLSRFHWSACGFSAFRRKASRLQRETSLYLPVRWSFRSTFSSLDDTFCLSTQSNSQ